jgi:hypothetical protein
MICLVKKMIEPTWKDFCEISDFKALRAEIPAILIPDDLLKNEGRECRIR